MKDGCGEDEVPTIASYWITIIRGQVSTAEILAPSINIDKLTLREHNLFKLPTIQE